jgi:DNA-binding response OmpR family regulator
VTVFIAEDNPILLQGLARALSANGFRVETAAHGRALLELLETRPLPDILLLDVMMPGLSGLEVLEAVRANPATAHLPVILITAAPEEVLGAAALDGPAAELLTKPFRLSELLSRLEEKVRPARTRPHSGAAHGTVPTVRASN